MYDTGHEGLDRSQTVGQGDSRTVSRSYEDVTPASPPTTMLLSSAKPTYSDVDRILSDMNRRSFLVSSMAATAAGPLSVVSSPFLSSAAPVVGESRVAVLLVDMDRVTVPIDERIYGQFLEHINHSVEDGLFAEQIRGAGFEGEDFKTYWEMFSDRGRVEVADLEFQNGKKSVRLQS